MVAVASRRPAADEAMPAVLETFGAAAWPPVDTEDDEGVVGCTAAEASAWRTVSAWRRWRTARRRWLTDHDQDVLPEFFGASAAQDEVWQQAVLAAGDGDDDETVS